jgi:hypothetical protein
LKRIGVFSSGFIIAIIPIIYIYALSPDKFIFGNLNYARLNTLYRVDVPAYGPMTIAQKFEYLFSSVISQPGNLLVTIAFLYFGVVVGLYILMQRGREKYHTFLLLIHFPFILIGSFLPTPSWYQYYYALVPFALLSISMITYLMKETGESGMVLRIINNLLLAIKLI